MATTKKSSTVTDHPEPQLDEAALVPDAPDVPEAPVSASEAGQRMLAEDAEALDELVRERVVEALVGLGVPQEVAEPASRGDFDAATAAADAAGAAADGITQGKRGDICTECYADGWETKSIEGFSGVGCVHGSWTR